MEKLDEMIKAALTEEERALWQQAGELSYFQQAFGIFRGRQGWVALVVMGAQIFMFIAALWCAVNFYQAADMLLALKWGMSAAVLALAALIMKMGLMPVMQADRVIRELKRVELMLARRG